MFYESTDPRARVLGVHPLPQLDQRQAEQLADAQQVTRTEAVGDHRPNVADDSLERESFAIDRGLRDAP